MDEDDGKTTKDKGKKAYELSTLDLRFLRAVDVVSSLNKNASIKLASDSAISTKVYGTRSVIGKIRSSQRGVTVAQLEKFAIYFNLDFNCFFRDIPKIEYDPKNIADKVVVKDNAQYSSGENGRNIQVSGGAYNETNNNYEKGAILEQVLYAEKVFKKSECPPELQTKCRKILEKIQTESTNIEAVLDRNVEDLKKMADLLEIETKNREKAEKERDKAVKAEGEIMKKYISLLEKV